MEKDDVADFLSAHYYSVESNMIQKSVDSPLL